MAEADVSLETFIRKAYDYLKEGRSEDALAALDEALKIDFEHAEVLYALKCLNWWQGKLESLDENEGDYARAFEILAQWKHYYSFLDKIGNNFDSCQYAIRRFVFSVALEALRHVENDGMFRHDPELLLYLGRCFKGIGDYDKACEYLCKAAGFRREAFYIDPQAVDLNALESELIKKLVAHTRDAGKNGAEINEWLPVYGAFTGVFSVIRKLNPIEATRLKQDVKSLENDLSGSLKDKEELLPRLLNKYLWLMGHFETNNNKEGVSEIILKIRLKYPAIYERYIR